MQRTLEEIITMMSLTEVGGEANFKVLKVSESEYKVLKASKSSINSDATEALLNRTQAINRIHRDKNKSLIILCHNLYVQLRSNRNNELEKRINLLEKLLDDKFKSPDFDELSQMEIDNLIEENEKEYKRIQEEQRKSNLRNSIV